MMKEKLAILDQLENKEITAEEAERKLAELRGTLKASKGKTIKVFIKSNDGDVVNVSVPLQLAKFLSKGSAHFSKGKLDNVDFKEIIEYAERGDIGELVNIESADGDIVKVYVE